jgi:hypothetical protein
MCPLPFDGESLTSWIDEVAANSHSSRSRAVDALGLRVRPDLRLAQLLVWIPDDVSAHVRRCTGLNEALLNRMTLARYTFVHTWMLRTFGRPWWYSVRFSAACTQCVLESRGRWQIAWRLAFVVLCPRHRCYLADRCVCGRRLNDLSRSVDARWCCAAKQRLAARGSVDSCDRRVADLPTIVATDPGLLTAQHNIADLTTVSPESAAPSIDRLRELMWLIDLVAEIGTVELVDDCQDFPVIEEFGKFCHDRDTMPRNGGPRPLSIARKNTLVMSGVIRSAARLVFTDDVDVQASWLCDRLRAKRQKLAPRVTFWAMAGSPIAHAIERQYRFR